MGVAESVVGVAKERLLETTKVILEVELKAIATIAANTQAIAANTQAIIDFTANMITNFANRLIG
ncbi:MAG: hypothetical protein H0U49_00235 [Parachlamydiaceae bacterium]|nr:hypothetical protein [Parachlamydiaceae bacterium]